jgi:hypothetical protein
MSDVSKAALAVLHRVADFLEQLPEDQIIDLADGRARLSYFPWGADKPVPPAGPRKRTAAVKAVKSDVDVTAICGALEAATTREEGRTQLQALPRVDDVRAVAACLGMTGIAKTAKGTLIDQIVELTIGGRLSSAAIRVL